MVDGRWSIEPCWAIVVVECETFIIRGGVRLNLFLCMGKSAFSNLQTLPLYIYF